MLTKEQFRLAEKIKYNQDLILAYENEPYDLHRLFPNKDERERYVELTKMSIKFCEEELLLLTGNPRGFLE